MVRKEVIPWFFISGKLIIFKINNFISGHGSQKRDADGDESDGFDETICPVDYSSAGEILDDDMNKLKFKFNDF